MVFLDTCIWIELCAARVPITEHEKKQAESASRLLKKLKEEQEEIITCNGQVLEIISAIQKVKLREYNRTCNSSNDKKVGNMKEYRNTKDFEVTKSFCRSVYHDFSALENKEYIHII